MRYTFPFILLVLLIAPVRADFTINLDAGILSSPASAPMKVDNTSGSLNGSLLLILDLGSAGTVSNQVQKTYYISGTNVVLGAGGFNTEGGTGETLTAFNISTGSNVSAGDVLALRWFPQITYSQYSAGYVPVAGDFYGTYTPGASSTPDGGDTWVVPASGLIDLNFFTTNSDGGGSQAAVAGLADVVVIPEPSTNVMVGLGLFLLAVVPRLRTKMSRIARKLMQ